MLQKLCKICNKETYKIFDALILQKYSTDYFQCKTCEFIQTNEPFWLNEAYSTAMTAIDVGLVYRNLRFSNILPSILDSLTKDDGSYVDFGGGYGMLVRIMRDKGYDFYLHDLYAENLFAKYFELEDFKGSGKFTALTSFEVFEHLVNPLEEIERMFKLSDTLIFSTELQPFPSFKNHFDWWYFMPETGQHIAFYSYKTLQTLEGKFNCNLYTNGKDLHILSKQKLELNPFLKKSKLTLLERGVNYLTRKNKEKRSSLLPKDFELYKSYLLNS